MSRAQLADPANPGPYTQIVIGKEGGSNNGGIIPILCDCHQGGNTMDVAEAPDGTVARDLATGSPTSRAARARLIRTQLLGSRRPARAGDRPGSLGLRQPDRPPVGRAARRAHRGGLSAGTGKYFGYFPTAGDSVQMADLTSPNGMPDWGNPIEPRRAHRLASSGHDRRCAWPAHVTVPGYDKHVLVGATAARPGPARGGDQRVPRAT